MDATVTGDGKAAVRRSADAWIPPIRRAPACGARTRAGGPCCAPAVRGKARCRMHGGAAGSGAQTRNRNALKHGYWSEAEAAERRRAGALLEAGERTLGEVEEGMG